MASELRKYGVGLVLAHQYLAQLEPEVRHAVLGNVGTLVVFRVGPEDARILALALNGTITSAIPLTSKDDWGPRWAEASIGRADRVVSLDVVTGTIRIELPDRR